MSSILDALRKLEAAQAQASKRGVFMPPPRSRRWPAIAAGVAFAAGVGMTLWLSGHRTGETPGAGHAEAGKDARPDPRAVASAKRPAPPAVEAPAAPAPDHAPVATAPPPVVAAPPPAPVAAPAAPAAVVPAVAPAAAPSPPIAAPPPTALPPAAPAPPLPRAVVEEQPPRGRVGAPAPPATPAAREPEEPPPVALAARQPAPPPVVEPEEEPELEARPPPDAPRVQLSFLIYSRVPERRAVALTVEGGSLTTLHEGESTGEIEVERINSNSVRLRHRGRSFTLRPRD